MLHPRLTPIGGAPTWLAQIGPYGAWSGLAYTTRYGEGACGMFEASWQMPLPADFEHPATRRGTLVELMDGPWRVGSGLVLTEPAKDADAWTITCTGVGREVEGDGSFYALNSSGDSTRWPNDAATQAIARGLPWAGVDASVPALPVGASASDDLQTVGVVLTAAADALGQRWGVGQDNIVRFMTDPTTPTWHVVPGVTSLGVADDDYATVVYGRYANSGAGGALATVKAPASASPTESRFGRREFPVDLTNLGSVTTAVAQGIVDGILAKSFGRLGWTDGLKLSSQELLSAGGVPADLSLVEAGQMIRLHGHLNDLLEFNGQTYLDIIIGETKYTDGASTIDVNPLGLAARDLASVVEAVTGVAA